MTAIAHAYQKTKLPLIPVRIQSFGTPPSTPAFNSLLLPAYTNEEITLQSMNTVKNNKLQGC